MANCLHAAGDRGTLHHALHDIGDINRDNEDDDRDAGNRQRRLKLVADLRLTCQPDQHLGPDPGNHNQGHELHADSEGIDEVPDGKILGIGRSPKRA